MKLYFFKYQFFILTLFLSQFSSGQDFTVPGEVTVPYPTILNLAVEWKIQGDENLNGIVYVQFREKGTVEWKDGMPLRRVPSGEFTGLKGLIFKWENKHSGSIFNLKPGTAYEIKLKLEDPDGGSSERIAAGQTRPEPAIGRNAEIIEINPGLYDTLHTKSGTVDKPVVYRCSKGEAVFTVIDLRDRKNVFVEGLTVRNNTNNGRGINLTGAENCVVRRCTVDAVYGIVAYRPGAVNCYFSDNVIKGTSVWTNEAMGASGKNIGEGIQMFLK